MNESFKHDHDGLKFRDSVRKDFLFLEILAGIVSKEPFVAESNADNYVRMAKEKTDIIWRALQDER